MTESKKEFALFDISQEGKVLDRRLLSEQEAMALNEALIESQVPHRWGVLPAKPERYLALDVSIPVSPAIVLHAPVDCTETPDAIAKRLEEALRHAIETLIPGASVQFVQPFEVKVNPQTDWEPRTSAERRQFRAELFDQLFQTLRQSCANTIGALSAWEIAAASHPDNGKDGYWSVVGTRHSAIVRATSATDAIDTAHASNLVDKTWEEPTTAYLGSEFKAIGF